MAKYEVSPDLINKLQIALRNESGISSFNLSDHLPPSSSPSILQDAIAAVGSNAEDAPRCDGCNGELLLGFDSTICVFCGRFPSNFHGGNSPKPISFVSTFGCQWFLRSLSLDGSESVERPIEGESESGRGQNSVTNEIPLSALLDLQLKWPNESNRLGVENEDGKPSTNLVGVNFDELFQREGSSETESAANSLNEKETASRKVEIKDGTTFAGQSSLSLFEKAQTGTLGGENDESDWAIEFQSANADSKVDTGFRVDSTDWSIKQEDAANISGFEAFPTSGTESKSEQPFDFQQSERNMPVNDGQKALETIDSFDWLPAADIHRVSDKGDPPHNDKLGGDDSTNWDEFGKFSGAENNQGEQVSAALAGSESGGGFNIDDSWNDFAGSVGPGHDQLENENNLGVHKPVYGVVDEFALLGHGGMEQLDVHVESSLSKTSDQGESLGLSGNKEVGGSFDLLNGFTSSGIVDNSLDVWSDFALSTGAVNSKPVNNDSAAAAMSDFSSIMVTHTDPPQNGETKSAENHMENDDAFGSWSDFGSSLKQPDSSFPELNLTGSRQDEVASGKDVELVEDKSSHNSWSNIGWSTSMLEQPPHAVEIEPSESKSTYQDGDLFLGLNGKSTSVNNEEIDSWTDFTSSSNGLPNNSHSTNVQTDVIQEPIIHDPFGGWNVINSASDNETSRVTAVDNLPQTNMFSTEVDSHVGSNSFMHQDPFLGMLTNKNGSPEMASSQTEVPNLIRTEHQDVEAGELSSISETASKEGSDQKSAVVENLISEMHDLSFMLENSLSIPNPGT